MVKLHIDLIAESLSIYGSKVNIVDTEVTEFKGFKLLSPNIQTLRKDILYVCVRAQRSVQIEKESDQGRLLCMQGAGSCV